MTFQSVERYNHDRINLGRLVKRLEKSVVGQKEEKQQQWEAEERLSLQRTSQKIKYARTLLNNVELHGEAETLEQSRRAHLDSVRSTLDRLESAVNELSRRTPSKRVRITPLLPTLPLPKFEEEPRPHTPPDSHSEDVAPESILLPSEQIPSPPVPAIELLLSSSDTFRSDPMTSPLIPPSLPASSLPPKPTSSTTLATGNPSFTRNSNLLHDELSSQLAQMAAQLKQNAIHFSKSLGKDQVLVEEAAVKLDENYDMMKRERLRVRDFKGKSGSTTCLVVMSVVVVMIAFFMMVMLIRWT
ncbi:hypothetical protein JAAARDRAFT_37032 [Jaapia argillacea MUCL 33604]|uniref:Uncharacterized protein n=1 Tax=Jaapia argillacea MUCL 33604 TaxID=933084 RepID=A0A067PP90_9AGAM|nr:hypothetical protein JAAARDRAFT_37032 [Jaapia argillacea MUCL 33604]